MVVVTGDWCVVYNATFHFLLLVLWLPALSGVNPTSSPPIIQINKMRKLPQKDVAVILQLGDCRDSLPD